MNTIDITDMNDAELDAFLMGDIEENAPCSVRIAFHTGVFHRDILSLRREVAAGDMTPEDASLWANLKHAANIAF